MDDTNAPSQATTVNNVVRSRAKGVLYALQDISEQPSIRRAIPALALIAASAFAIFIYIFLGQQNTATIYSGMPEADKARAIEILTAGGVTATLDERSGKITIDQSEYHKARMLLASQGLPQGIPDGYATLDNMPMGTSRSIEAARLKQMQELELARSISELDPVSSARVHLALPEKSAFVRDKKPASASVVLHLKAGHYLDEAQVNAIVSLVATSVPEMTRSGVSVVDHSGRLLSSISSDPVQNLSDMQLKHQMKMESLYQQRIEALILPMVGVGNAAIEVSLDIDFTRSEVTTEQYAPEETALRSEQQMLEESARAPARGIPGAVTNTPPPAPELEANAPALVNENNQMQNRSSSSTRNFEISRRVETILPQTAKITRVNAAVLLRTPDGSSGSSEPFSEEYLNEIERLVKSAISFNETRGDTITVSNQSFANPAPPPKLPWYEMAWMSQAGRQAIQLIALAVIVLGVVRPILNRVLIAPEEEAEIQQTFTAQVEVAEGESMSDLQTKLDEVLEKGVFGNDVSYDDKVALVTHLANTDTAKLATVFQNMIDAEEDAVQ